MIKITLLTKADCAFCDQAKDALERLSVDFPVAVETYVLESDAGLQAAQAAGALFAPVVLLNGTAFSQGRLSERKLRRQLERLVSIA
jgi:glutaredoxin